MTCNYLSCYRAVMRGVEWIAEAISGKKTQQFQTCKCNKAAQVKVSVTPNDFGRRYMCCFHRGVISFQKILLTFARTGYLFCAS